MGLGFEDSGFIFFLPWGLSSIPVYIVTFTPSFFGQHLLLL